MSRPRLPRSRPRKIRLVVRLVLWAGALLFSLCPDSSALSSQRPHLTPCLSRKFAVQGDTTGRKERHSPEPTALTAGVACGFSEVLCKVAKRQPNKETSPPRKPPWWRGMLAVTGMWALVGGLVGIGGGALEAVLIARANPEETASTLALAAGRSPAFGLLGAIVGAWAGFIKWKITSEGGRNSGQR